AHAVGEGKPRERDKQSHSRGIHSCPRPSGIPLTTSRPPMQLHSRSSARRHSLPNFSTSTSHRS
ncbi:hypothetical protein PMAYCL1PPCAC_31093, partial [Pristionchus mayeri]